MNPDVTMGPAPLPDPPVEDEIRTGFSAETIKHAFLDNLLYRQGRYPANSNLHDQYMALAHTVRDRLMTRWFNTIQTYRRQDSRVVCYLSAEFLLGPHLANNLLNLGMYDEAKQALGEMGLDINELIAEEAEPGLGNGGLGRLAACFLDSLATIGIPAIGYGIRYEFGIFCQTIHDGWQVERTDKWLQNGNPWEVPRPDSAVEVQFGGHTERYTDAAGRYRLHWIPDHIVKGIPYDTPIVGYRVQNANNLRLWKAEAAESFDFSRFNTGDYLGAVREKVNSENISKVLYPNDQDWSGKTLRLEQQYFFVSCSLQDIIRHHVRQGRKLEEFNRKWTIQLNDTHPSIGVAELMRLLLDDYALSWDKAWEVTQQTFGYTNHTLLPEALEQWPLPLFATLLPRHLEIIYEINRRFLDDVRAKFPGDDARAARMSLIGESGGKQVRMAHLATVGSHAVNGVAALHSDLLKRDLLRDFYEMYPERFSNKTNGVTPRRWMALSNPRLTRLISDRIGEGWISDLDEIKGLELHAGDEGFRHEWRRTQEGIKSDLAQYIRDVTDIVVDPKSMFDVQVKRLHEYKRQHLNVLHILALYHRIKADPGAAITPRTFIFGGKAAPGYAMAKLIIKLIHEVGRVLNSDPDVAGRLKVVFLPDYSVSLGQRVYPAADLSEQISTAGKEASGTGCMKFAMNGALTIGTLDGANVEMREAVGEENFFLFGLTADQVAEWKAGGYQPWKMAEQNEDLLEVVDSLISGVFSRGDTSLFRPIYDSLMGRDEYMLLADYQSYVDCQDRVSAAYNDPSHWSRMSILNVARMGRFSSDRTIREYCADIWYTSPVSVRPASRKDTNPQFGASLNAAV